MASKYTAHLAVRVTPAELRRLERIAKRSRLTTATVVRYWIASSPNEIDVQDAAEELAALGDRPREAAA